MNLHIDIETYSSLELSKVGVYRYTESPDFEILLLAWAFDDQPVQICDFAQGQVLPRRLLHAFRNPEVKKHAHNAAFERTALRAAGYDIPVHHWHCTMVQAAYCGLPLSLDKLSSALNLAEAGKMAEGQALIRYFCKLCSPNKANNMRVRNFPHHDKVRWELFREYCMQDVEAEREVYRRVRDYKPPAQERAMYMLDQKINDTGIKIDLDFAAKAVYLDARYSDIIQNKLQELTQVENPNSAQQLKDWLSDAMEKGINSLAKQVLPELLGEAEPGVVRDVLKLRQKASKTSIKKYAAMLGCACEDGRAHGLFQYYGANRTGRWAGRLIQLQNLPQNHLNDLDLMRELIIKWDLETLRIFFDDISEVLSQLIRTAFIAEQNRLFVVVDFSAIEARVIAWLAYEDWRLEVFSTHGKIYEASAAMMFNVPLEEITKGSLLRTKGKISELALGFGGSVGALKNMGGEAMGLAEPEMREIVRKWRKTNPQIVSLWKDIEMQAIQAIKTRKPVYSQYRGLVFNFDGLILTITLPSGRQLCYYKPSFRQNRFGRQGLCYRGMDQVTKKWTYIETYGGKLVENIIQAIARDLLAYALLQVDARGYKVVMHVHDELVCEVPGNTAAYALDEIRGIMSTEVPWAKELPLRAEGYITPFYKKD